MKARLLGMIVLASLGGCARVGDMFTGKGLGEVTDLRNGTLEITAAGSFSANRQTTQDKWDRTATAACGGRAYTTIKREWQSAEYPGILSGIIRCR
jgi:hypothetical protein